MVPSAAHSPSSVGPISEADCDLMQPGQKPARLSWFILGSDTLWELLPLPCLLAEICCSCKHLQLALNAELVLFCSSQPLKFLLRKMTGVHLLVLCCFLLGCAVLLSPSSLLPYSLNRLPRKSHVLPFLLLKCLTAVIVGDCSRAGQAWSALGGYP